MGLNCDIDVLERFPDSLRLLLYQAVARRLDYHYRHFRPVQNGSKGLFRVIQEKLKHQAILNGITDPVTILKFIRDGTTTFYADFSFWVNIIALLLQSIVASRLVRLGDFV